MFVFSFNMFLFWFIYLLIAADGKKYFWHGILGTFICHHLRYTLNGTYFFVGLVVMVDGQAVDEFYLTHFSCRLATVERFQA